jgi:hypothetical protein
MAARSYVVQFHTARGITRHAGEVGRLARLGDTNAVDRRSATWPTQVGVAYLPPGGCADPSSRGCGRRAAAGRDETSVKLIAASRG